MIIKSRHGGRPRGARGVADGAGSDASREALHGSSNAEVMRGLAATSSKAALRAALAAPCNRHGAAGGEPCWTVERSTPGAGRSAGACGSRLRRAGLDGARTSTDRPGRRRPTSRRN